MMEMILFNQLLPTMFKLEGVFSFPAAAVKWRTCLYRLQSRDSTELPDVS